MKHDDPIATGAEVNGGTPFAEARGYAVVAMICLTCGGKVERHPPSDTIYCPHCGVWLEPKCSDNCDFCNSRPEFPPRPNP